MTEGYPAILRAAAAQPELRLSELLAVSARPGWPAGDQ